jgi:hypothetical protein
MITLGTQRHLAATAGFALWLSLVRPAAAQSPPYDNDGLRWIGVAASCKAPVEWTAARVFRSPQLPSALAQLCLYTWQAEGQPAPAQIAQLFQISGAQQLTEDVPVLAPSAPFSAPELALLRGLRAGVRAQVGDATLLPRPPKLPAARIVVIDSAPDAIARHIQIGASRHGDTIAHLIEDLVCVASKDGPPSCAAEITTELALPWIARGVIGANGGYSGTLADLARAIERAVATWQSDRRTSPGTTPPRLILNLSVGWEHSEQIADCSTDPKRQAPPSRAVLGILQQAVAQGALIIAAAGNDSGGPAPRRGLLCPARYQAVPQDADPAQSLVLAVSGVDYHDAPLENVRPQGITALAALGLGGVAWDPADPAPPQLVGSSVSAGVASAVAALVWAYDRGRAPGELAKILYDGGVEIGEADQCPRTIPSCASRRISVCGALRAAGAPITCAIPAAQPGSSPALPGEVDALEALYAGIPAAPAAPIPVAGVARFVESSVQVEPSIFPQPISGTCPTCVIRAESTTDAGTVLVPALDQELTGAAIVGRFADGGLAAAELGTLAPGTPYKYKLPPGWPARSAYLTGFDPTHYSVTIQLLVR